MKEQILSLSVLGILFFSNSYACNSILGVDSNYNLAGNSNPTLDIQVARSSQGTKCDWYVTITKGNYNDGTYNRYLSKGSHKLYIDIRNQADTETLKDLPDAIPPANVISGNFDLPAEGLTKIAKYKYKLASVPADAKSGTYNNTWTIKLYSKINPATTYSLAASSTIGAYYDVNTSLDVSIVAAGAPFDLNQTLYTMNFGTLAQNAIQNADMIVYSNTDYTYTLSSANNGKIKRMGGDTSTPNTLSYQLSVAATTYSGAVTVSSYPYTSVVIIQPNKSTLRFPLTVQILDNPNSKLSGTYTDTITVTLTAM